MTLRTLHQSGSRTYAFQTIKANREGIPLRYRVEWHDINMLFWWHLHDSGQKVVLFG